MATGDTCKSFLPHESAVCQGGTRLGTFIPLMDVACLLLLRVHALSSRYFCPAAV